MEEQKHKKKEIPWYDKPFFKWLYSTKKPSKQTSTLTPEQQAQLVKLNGGWYEDELFIPMMTKREAMLRYASTWKAIWFFCIPTIILMVVQGLYNIVDKSLSLVYVTPHAVKNLDYMKYMIMGDGNGNHTILLDALQHTSNINIPADIAKIIPNYLAVNPDKAMEIATNFFTFDNNGLVQYKNNNGQALLDYLNNEHIEISSSKMKEYINVSTQYTVQSYNIVLSFTQILAIGAGMHYSTEFGKRNKEKLKEIAGNGITYSFIASILVGFLLFSLSFRPWGQVLISSQMGSHRNLIVEEMAWKDVEPLIYGISAIFLAYLTMNMLRSEGKMIHIMIMTITSLVVKFVTSILLMKYTSLELTGAQMGTIFSFLYQFIYCLFVMFFSKVTYSNFTWRNLWDLKISNLTYSLKAGFPNFINYFAFVVNGYVSTALVIRLPESKAGPSVVENGGVSINQQLISAITPWNDFILSACVGLNQGVRTMIAYNNGAGKNERILEILKRSSWLMFGWFCFILVMIFAIGPYMLRLFAFPAQYAHYGNVFYWYLVLFFMFYPLACFTYIDLGLFQGKGRTVAATISSSLRALVIFVPLTFIGWAVARATGNPIWYFFFIGLTDLVSAFILVPMLIGFYIQQKRTNQIHDKRDDDITLASYYKLLIDTSKDKKEVENYKRDYDLKIQKITNEHNAQIAKLQ
ncbi:MATE family efflux transporter [Mesoplasma lactucae]|uniref:Uncharacterized protein n=1 Tax=Mesoplasma lactucae ATCC 49193 TaxID=81460 RepID=A0A291ISN6_9MOLU|nr:MATE family efflux transporter [Mesoplasma lactucae]ATG97716.1 hypothetical protein CP520_03190 [Mesoplasma lactucae ATCC 49193]ATZ20509.1 hypothetical protein MLACT_v1c06880 [Mesoplasma lactucae ATCC 49193]MCL8216680.1 hypothetical protein [Mesoplasma lactucae ATCC 49193]